MQQLSQGCAEMDNIEWGDWVTGTIDPKIFMDNSINFENRRALGVWQYRIGHPRLPVIDQIYLYGQKNDEWKFSEDQNPADTHCIIIETQDGEVTGAISIQKLAG